MTVFGRNVTKISELIIFFLRDIGWRDCDTMYSSDGILLIYIKRINYSDSRLNKVNLLIDGDRIVILNPLKDKNYYEGEVSLYDPDSLDQLYEILNNAKCSPPKKTIKGKVEIRAHLYNEHRR